MSHTDLEALEDTLHLLADRQAMKDLAAAREDVRAGRSFSADDLRDKHLRR